MARSVVTSGTICRVSSVLGKDGRQYGKQHMFDGEGDTCWNSDQGSHQWIALEFSTPVEVTELHLQFHGGFSASRCLVQTRGGSGEPTTLHEFYPEDSGALQVFALPNTVTVDNLKIVAVSLADTFGRLTVYKLDVRGT